MENGYKEVANERDISNILPALSQQTQAMHPIAALTTTDVEPEGHTRAHQAGKPRQDGVKYDTALRTPHVVEGKQNTGGL